MLNPRDVVLLFVTLVLATLATLAFAQDEPRVRFIPICTGDDVVECIPPSGVANQERLKLWSYASRQLPNCTIVILDPELPMTAGNLGFRCNGTLTAGGLLANEDGEP